MTPVDLVAGTIMSCLASFSFEQISTQTILVMTFILLPESCDYSIQNYLVFLCILSIPRCIVRNTSWPQIQPQKQEILKPEHLSSHSHCTLPILHHPIIAYLKFHLTPFFGFQVFFFFLFTNIPLSTFLNEDTLHKISYVSLQKALIYLDINTG